MHINAFIYRQAKGVSYRGNRRSGGRAQCILANSVKRRFYQHNSKKENSAFSGIYSRLSRFSTVTARSRRRLKKLDFSVRSPPLDLALEVLSEVYIDDRHGWREGSNLRGSRESIELGEILGFDVFPEMLLVELRV